jgi:hypothetical protein
VAAGAAIVGMVGAGAGWSAAAITSADIANNTVRSADVKNGTLKVKDLNAKTVAQLKGATGPQGPQGPAGTSGTATYAGPNWSIVDRNVIKNGDSYLRSGPATPPKGVGSLGLRTGDGNDKAAFGNEKDFLNAALSTINTVKYSVFVTGEDLNAGQPGNTPTPTNAPSVAFEVDPTGTGSNTAPNFSTLVFVPPAFAPAAANTWTELDGTTAAQWYLTGAAGTASNCNQVTYCTLAAVKAFYANASVLTAQITKGRDNAFSGAVDALVINTKTYDFEPFGVTSTG